MNFEEIIRKRTATRQFKDKTIEESLLNKILASGRLAPTAKNLQPQKIYVVKSEEGLQKIDRITPCRYNAPICLLVCSDKNIAWKKDDYSSYEMDATIVATHMILEATNLGVDNIWIRYFNKEEVQKEFNLKENIVPICIIPLGYKTENCPMNPNHTQRKNLEETVEYI